MQEVLVFSPAVPDASNFLPKRTVDNDSYISKLRSGFKHNCHKIGGEPGKSRDLHTCKERYNRRLPLPFFSFFFSSLEIKQF